MPNTFKLIHIFVLLFSTIYLIVYAEIGLYKYNDFDNDNALWETGQSPPSIPVPVLLNEPKSERSRQKRQSNNVNAACKHAEVWRKSKEIWDHYTTSKEKETYYGFRMQCNNGKIRVLGCLETELFVPINDKKRSNVYQGYDITCSKKGFDYVVSNSERVVELDTKPYPRHRRQAGTKACAGHKVGEEYNKGFYKYRCTETGPKAIKCIDLEGKEYKEGDTYDVIKTYRMKCFKTDDGWVVEAIACIDSNKNLVEIGGTQRGGWYQRTCLEVRSEKGTQTAVALNITHCCELNTDHCVAVGGTEPSVVLKDLTFKCIKEGNEYFYRYFGEDNNEVEVEEDMLNPQTTTTEMPTTTDPCYPNPCVHGTCTDNPLCTCEPGWTGELCDEPIDECASSPCVHGNCIDGENGFLCQCDPGFTGRLCDQELDECASSPCVNGTCSDDVGGYKCSCAPGFTGINCDEDINECLSSPCLAGECRDDVNSYNCICEPGFTGDNCDEEIDNCASNACRNGGVCIDNGDQYACACVEGFTGENCETPINECASNPCMNGNCIDGHNSYTCVCDNGFTGIYCEEEIDPCPSQPCQNGGQCVKVGPNKFICQCRKGWEGKYCEERTPSNCDDDRWLEHDDHCYYVSDIDDRKNASEAMQNCWENGAHLLVVNDQLEWEFVQSELDQKRFSYPATAQDGFWVGLTLDLDWKWIRPDGMIPIPWLRANRLKRQVDEMKKCGEVKWDLTQWGMDKDHCSHQQWFICEKYRDDESVPDIITEPPIEPERCDNGWLKYGDNCYLVSNTPANNNDAQGYCEDQGAYLVVVNDRFEWDFVERGASKKAQTMPDQGFDGYWIGFELDDQNVWDWMKDGGMQPIPWLPFDLRKLQRQFGRKLSCGEMRFNYEQWGADKDHCIHEQGFICEMDPNAPSNDSNERPMVEPVQCKRGWMSYQNQCYYVSKPKEREDFGSAVAACKAKGAEILSMFNDAEWNFVRDSMERIKNLYPGQGLDGFWIGLRFNDGNDEWHWIDSKGMTNIPWMSDSSHQDDQDSNSPLRQCGEMRYLHNEWSADNDHCGHRQWYICVKRPFDQQKPDYVDLGAGCPSGWTSYQGHCYFTSSPGTYTDMDEAKATCASQGSHLAIAENIQEWSFLTKEATQRGSVLPDKGFDGFWIGLMKKPQTTTWEWNDGSVADEIPWVEGDIERSSRQSRQYGSVVTCGEIRWDTEKWGADMDHCLHKQGYICEMEPQNAPGDCRAPEHQCPMYSSQCEAIDGGYKCVCSHGYKGDGYTCKDVDECTDGFSNPCGQGALCQNSPGSFKCYCMAGYKGDPPKIQCATMALCVTYGDPHFRGFDNSIMHYQGTCRYVLAQTQHIAKDSPAYFSVEAQGETRYGVDEFSWTSEVFISAYGHIFGLHKNGRVTIDGLTVPIPYSLMNNTVDIARNPIKDMMFKSKAGIEVMFDGDSRAEVYIPTTYQKQTRGLCGDFDGDPKNDWLDPSGRLVHDERDFGDSWITKSNQISPQCNARQPITDKCKAKYRESENFCQPLTDKKGPFTNCYQLIGIDANEYFKSCAIDVCALGPQLICSQFETLADMCAQKGLVIRNWRTFLGCTMEEDCEANEQYESCGPGCEETCASIFKSNPQRCPYPCEEGCFCKPGFVRSQENCIPKANCGCTTGSKYMQAGDVFFKNGCTEMCTCEAIGDSLSPSCAYADCGEGICRRDGSVETCVCPSGFTGNGTTCFDVNECMMLDSACPSGQECQNTHGSYKCMCSAGYKENPVTGACVDIDECKSSTPVCGDIIARCYNLPGGYTCTCPPGFVMVYANGTNEQVNYIPTNQSPKERTPVKCVSSYQFFSGKQQASRSQYS